MNYFYDIFEDKTLGMCIRETSDQGHIYVWDLIYLFDESHILNQLIINNNLDFSTLVYKDVSFLRSKDWILKNHPELFI
jgi:hypothetical protein